MLCCRMPVRPNAGRSTMAYNEAGCRKLTTRSPVPPRASGSIVNMFLRSQASNSGLIFERMSCPGGYFAAASNFFWNSACRVGSNSKRKRCCLSAPCHKAWEGDNLFCSARELSRRGKMPPSHWSPARRNILETFCFAAQRPLPAVSELTRRAMRLNPEAVERTKHFRCLARKIRKSIATFHQRGTTPLG